jgi:uncharacterized glyoxalase superfamily protein PhnB
MSVEKIPEGNSVIPSLVFDDAKKAIKLYEEVFGAEEVHRIEMPDGSGKIMHSCLIIGNSKIFVYDANPAMRSTPTSSTFYVYVDDADAIHAKAKKAGFSEIYPMNDAFWGDRTGGVKDPFGNGWSLATHMRDVSPEEMKEGAKQWGKQAA